MRNSSQAALVRKNVDCPEICVITAVVEYRQASEYSQRARAEGAEFLFPGVVESGDNGNLALMPA